MARRVKSNSSGLGFEGNLADIFGGRSENSELTLMERDFGNERERNRERGRREIERDEVDLDPGGSRLW